MHAGWAHSNENIVSSVLRTPQPNIEKSARRIERGMFDAQRYGATLKYHFN